LEDEIKDQESKAEIEEFRGFIAENEDVILNLKNQMLRMLNAFMKAGTNLEKEIYPKLKYKGLYMPEFSSEHICDHGPSKDQKSKDEEDPEEPLHPYTYNEVIAQEQSVQETINSQILNAGTNQRQGTNALTEVYI